MEVFSYLSPLPAQWIAKGSFVDRNPNMSYLAVSGDRHCALIDACSDAEAVLRDVAGRNLKLDCLLITHYHHDHTFALADWLGKFPDLPVGIHSSSLGALSGARSLFPLRDGMTVAIGSETLKVLAAPGHTYDSLCFWDERGGNLFTGDVIFGGNIGCSDYRKGGNRNVFYRTIRDLLNTLPSAARIYPGHLSEHYRTPPPYALAGEKINNPYLADALAGRRGNFDRALKLFSLEFETGEAVMIEEAAMDDVCSLEREIWIPELQASRETIQERLRQGHKLLALRENGGYAGMAGWCYSPFSLEDGPACFPESFRQFSDCKSCGPADARSAFIYNVGVKPDARRKGAGSLLLQEAFEKIRKDGINQVLLDSRMPSYNGSGRHAQESVERSNAFRDAVDRYLSGGALPEKPVFLLDPAVRFYMKNGFSPWIIRRDFIRDEPSGNMRVICYINLDRD